MPPRRPETPRTYPVCSLQDICQQIENTCGNAVLSETHGEGSHKVVLLPEATEELKAILSYGRRSPMNSKEQKFTGYGHFLTDHEGNTIVIVKHFIEIQTMNRNAVGASNLGPNGENNPGLDFLAYHREEFLAGEKKYNTDAFGHPVDPFLSLCGGSEFVMEGHSHPDLGTFYSRTDRVSGAARAASSPVCIFVCDPIRKEMLGSIGKNFEKAQILVYERAASVKKQVKKERPTEPALDEIARLTGLCLRTRGYSGRIRLYTRFDGRVCIKLHIISPKARGDT